ncbi:MAG: response regulator [Desulfobacterales bacterium]|nr:response regulator [Desulfobacterales bacterium]
MGYAELALLTTPEKDEMDSHLKAIFQASIRARDLIKQILAFSRQEKQEQFPMLLQPVVEEGLKMMRASLPATIEIRHDFKPGLSPVLSNPTQIHQVLMNLCTNAGHAMQENGGVLEVKLNQVEIDSGDPALLVDMLSGCYQVLTVSDTGHGMAASVKERIFDPFFTTKGPGKGTGMGLSVVHGIIKSQGGKVICHSEPGKGTIFEVFFPASEEEVSEKSEPVDSIPLGSERILFVDDEAAIVDIGTRMLQSLGYSVVGKTNSIHALETFRSQPDQFDLLITDNFMPAMTGLELSKNIKRIRPHLPVILCTGFSEGLSDEKVKAHGIEGFVMKPIIREKMAKIIRNVIGG